MRSIIKMTFCLLGCGSAWAQSPVCSSADLFHAYLETQLPKSDLAPLAIGNIPAEPYHYVLNSTLQNALEANQLGHILDTIRGSGLKDLNDNQQTVSFAAANEFVSQHPTAELLSQEPLTIIIVPGIFGEFIKTRPFEEVFSQKSAASDNYVQQLQSLRKGRSAPATAALASADPYYDAAYSLEDEADVIEPLENLVQVAAIPDASGTKTLVKLVLLATPFASFETLGKIQDDAQIFNRRLEKYLALNQDSNVFLLGYSRGADFALEMLSQETDNAKSSRPRNANYLSKIKGVISYSGVVFGSSLADTINDAGSTNQKLSQGLRRMTEDGDSKTDALGVQLAKANDESLMKALDGFLGPNDKLDLRPEMKDRIVQLMGRHAANPLGAYVARLLTPSSGTAPDYTLHKLPANYASLSLSQKTIWKTKVLVHNLNVFLNLAEVVSGGGQHIPTTLASLKKDFDSLALLSKGDMESSLELASLMWKNLQLSDPAKFNGHVDRFRELVTAALDGVTQLTTAARQDWWKNHTIPSNIKYYTLSASMANPTLGAQPEAVQKDQDLFQYDKALYFAKRGYDNGIDDNSLIANQTQYTEYQSGQLYLNDSQVSVVQSSFIPGVIYGLNPAQTPIVADHLGILSTHHWGITLEVVNAQKDGALNPFPRVSILKSLASILAVDLQGLNPSRPECQSPARLRP